MRVTYSIEPGPVIESHRLDHQRVALPVADRIPHPGRVRIFRQLPSIHMDLPVAPGAALIEQRHKSGRLDDAAHRIEYYRRTGRRAVRSRNVLVEVLASLRDLV